MHVVVCGGALVMPVGCCAVPRCAVLCIGKGPTGLSTMTGMAWGTPTGTWMQGQQQAWQQ